MPNLEWLVPQQISSRGGTIDLNVTDAITLRRFQVLPDTYKIVPSLRVTTQDESRQDGSVIHPRFKTGLIASLRVSFWVMESVDDVTIKQYACDADLCEMNEQLMTVLDELRWTDTSVDVYAENRYFWTPSCSDSSAGSRRMLTGIALNAWPQPTVSSEIETYVDFELECPFSYGVDEFATTTAITVGTTVVNNVGSTRTWPTIRLDGPLTGSDTASIQNGTTGQQINYDAGRPGTLDVPGGHYLEIDTFYGTVLVDGDSSQNAIAGIVPASTDFWQLVLGANSITSDTAGEIIWSPAWA